MSRDLIETARNVLINEDAEQVDEGKYKKYADLLIKKADMLKKGMDTMQVDKELDKEFENITGKRAVKGHSFRD